MSAQPSLPGLAESANQDHAAYGEWLSAQAEEGAALQRRLNQHCARRDAPLVVEGGRAATAIVAGWAWRYAGKHREATVFVHHVGSTRESRRLDNLLFRLLSAIQLAHGIKETLPHSPEARVEVLPNWLARAAAGGKLIIVLTGLDALEGGEADQGMAWLPNYLPPGARLIVQTEPGAVSEMLNLRGWQREAIGGAGGAEVDTALDHALQANHDSVLQLLWAARRGVESTVLESAVPHSAEALQQHTGLVYPTGDGYALAGGAVQDAVRRRLLKDGADQQAAYLRLAELYDDRSAEAAIDALPWLLPLAAHWQALAEFLGDPQVLQTLLAPARRDDLLACWREWDPDHKELDGFYHSLLDDWRASLSPSRFANLVLRLAEALQMHEDHAAVEPFYQAVQALHSDLTTLETATLDDAYGSWLNDQDRHDEAEPLLRGALQVRSTELGAEHTDTRMSRHRLATLLEARGDLNAASELYRETLSLREKALGPRHPELLPHLANYAAVRKAANDLDAAKSLYQRALAIAERSHGHQHPTTAATVDSLAGVLYSGHDLQQAENLYQRALGVTEAAFGPDHPATAASAHNLATVLDSREQYKAAEDLYRRALNIRQQVYGDDHSDTASTLHNLACALDAMGNSAKAEPLYRQAIEVWERLVGAEHPATATSVNNLADLLREKGDYDEAESLYRRNLETWTKLFGQDHPHTLMTRSELAALYADQKQYQVAEPMLRNVMEQIARVMGPDDMQYINSAIKLSALLRDSGRRDEAKDVLRQVITQAEGKISLLSPRLQKLRRHLDALEKDPDQLH